MMSGYIIDEIKFQTLWPLGLVSRVKLDPSKINLNPNPSSGSVKSVWSREQYFDDEKLDKNIHHQEDPLSY